MQWGEPRQRAECGASAEPLELPPQGVALKLESQLEQAQLLPPLEEALELELQLEPRLPLEQVEPPLLEEAGLVQSA